MKTQLIQNSAALLGELKETYGASAIKLSTEDAGMSFEQIKYWAGVASPLMPVVVKIGGPEAKNDMKMVSELNTISGIIGPMIESAYSLQKYISSLKEVSERFQKISKHINIETISAYNNLSQILAVADISLIEEITIGRGDLSRSMSKEVDDPEVNNICKEVVERANEKNIKISIGGAINPKNAKRIFEEIKPDKINTRSLVFERNCSNIEASVLKALEFEIIMSDEDIRLGFISSREGRERIEKLKQRMSIIQ